MKVACFGDICGESGRNALIQYLQSNKNQFDLVIANGENAAHGFGITENICNQLFAAGINVITLGNHSFDRKSDLHIFDKYANLIRPLNYPENTIGKGFTTLDINGKKVLIINLIGRVFMELNDDPFTIIDRLLNELSDIKYVIVDFHAEASAEKKALGYFLDGRISCLFGTHTHVPTADAQILPNGTGYITDCGMCGDYNSVIGVSSETAVVRFINKVQEHNRLIPATNSNSTCVCGVVFDLDIDGKCKDIKTIRSGTWIKD